VDTRVAGPSLTAREMEVARMLGLGLTNKEIARELDISTRTVGAHVQNILNKLGATNRAQVAAWAARQPAVRPVAPRALASPARDEVSALSRHGRHFSGTLQLAGLVMAGMLATVFFPADHAIAPPSASAAISSQRGNLIYEARFDPDGHEFSLRYALNDPDASSIQIVKGGIEYSVLKPGGNTGNRLSIAPLGAFYAEYEISVRPRSNVVFWIQFSADDPSRYVVHMLEIATSIESMQLGYFSGGDNPIMPLGPQVALGGLQSGKHFALALLVQPPLYRVFLDGVRVIDVNHQSPRRYLVPSFGIFGEDGMVRLSAIRVYNVG
jgi:DNA-binding CsgD family transcriptional regulator